MAFLSAWMADLHGQTVAEADTVSLYGERKDRYAAAAQITIENDTDEREVFDRILSALGEK